MKDRHFTLSWTALLLLALAGIATEGSGCRREPDYHELEYAELRDITIPDVERVTLANGMRLLLLEDHELPLITVSALIHVGSVYEPPEKAGLAAVSGTVMRTGGTTSQTGDTLDEALESIAASVETSIGLDAGRASLSVLKEDIDTGLAILADILMHPAFREDKVALAKMQMRSAIARRNDSPEQLALREFRKLVYGPSSPYARQPEYATIDLITREDLSAFHRRYFGSNNILMAVCGDFLTEEMIQKMARAFAGWGPIDPNLPPLPKAAPHRPGTINLIRRREGAQTIICLGHLGGFIRDPDHFALTLMNQIFSASFTGRLFKSVRSRQGLAYAIGGTYEMEYAYPGVFMVGCATQSENTVRALRAMVEEVRRIRQEEVTDAEFALAKESYLNSFIFRLETDREIVQRLMTYEYHGYPADFMQKTRQEVERVTKADILRAAQEHLHPDMLQVLVVGRPEEFDEPLSTLGDANEIDIAAPPSGPGMTSSNRES